MSAILSHCRVILNALLAGEEPTNEQSYRYLTNDGDFKLQDDSHDMDPTTEKKNSTMSRAGDESTYGADTLERTMIRYGDNDHHPETEKFDTKCCFQGRAEGQAGQQPLHGQLALRERQHASFRAPC